MLAQLPTPRYRQLFLQGSTPRQPLHSIEIKGDAPGIQEIRERSRRTGRVTEDSSAIELETSTPGRYRCTYGRDFLVATGTNVTSPRALRGRPPSGESRYTVYDVSGKLDTPRIGFTLRHHFFMFFYVC